MVFRELAALRVSARDPPTSAWTPTQATELTGFALAVYSAYTAPA
jgi:hypothetical protein